MYTEGGWQGLSYPAEYAAFRRSARVVHGGVSLTLCCFVCPRRYGGQGMPYSLALMSTEMAATANWTWTMYPGLSKGAINTILSHCTTELKEKYLPPLISGEWTGTMCLTEPQCGSDLAQVTTKAVPQGDGTYKITGTKIFISCGEHDMTDNIIHCVLARLPDAPEGTKGISLFLVPKRKVADDGTVGDLNGANIGRIEDKMGCHGSSTCEINFEDAEGCVVPVVCLCAGAAAALVRSLFRALTPALLRGTRRAQLLDRQGEPRPEPHVYVHQHIAPGHSRARHCRRGGFLPERSRLCQGPPCHAVVDWPQEPQRGSGPHHCAPGCSPHAPYNEGRG